MTRQHDGLGLGVALVKHIVELHGGMVRAESDGPGRGATFTITLRRASAADVADATSRLPEPPPHGATVAGFTALVVDDEPGSARDRCGRTGLVGATSLH